MRDSSLPFLPPADVEAKGPGPIRGLSPIPGSSPGHSPIPSSRSLRWKMKGTAMASADSRNTLTMKLSMRTRRSISPVSAEPAMHAVMKHEKTKPWGICAWGGIRGVTGVKTSGGTMARLTA